MALSLLRKRKLVCHVDSEFISPLDLSGYRIKDNSNAQVPDLYDNLEKRNKTLKDEVEALKKWKSDMDKDKGGLKPTLKSLGAATPALSVPAEEKGRERDDKLEIDKGGDGLHRLGASGNGGRKPFYVEKKMSVNIPLNPWDRA